jgi:hypothetical protein
VSARFAPLLALGCAVACTAARYNNTEGPGVTLPAHFAEGSEQAGKDVDGGADAAPAAAPHRPTGSLPDPKALHEARQWEYDVVYDRGKVRVKGVRLLTYSTAVPSQRHMGRYAIELWIGRELVDRIRFDFPLLGAEEVPGGKRKPLHAPPSFAEGAVVSRKVLVPASRRATRAVLVDRATGEQQVLPWPPEAPLGPPRAQMPPKKPSLDAGAADSDGGAPAR